MINQTVLLTDAELVAASLDGKREAFGTLVERHQQFVCALAYAKTGSRAASEDIAQEAFVAAWKNLAGLRTPENFRGWLAGMARHLAAKFHRGARKAIELTEDVADGGAVSPSEEAMTHEEEAMLWATLARLPESHREPLILFYRGGQSVREIADALGLSEDATKQRLSRGRAMLQEAVRAKVESTLAQARPGAAFTLAVLAAIPMATSSAQAAGTGLTVAKGGGALVVAAAAKGLLPLLGGAAIGLAGAWVGMKTSLKNAESARERRVVVRASVGVMASLVALIAAMAALIYWSKPMLAARPGLWMALMAGTVVVFTASNFLFAAINNRAQMRVRAEERHKRGMAPDERAVASFEYRSRIRFLGLPLVHVRYGGPSSLVAKGWIAYGPVAIAPLFACGGVAVGGIALGGVSIGLVTTAGIGIGLFSFSGLAAGGVVLGGLALGWIAMGGAAWGWLAAFGGRAVAGVYGLGRNVSAPHANDAVARAFFHDHGLTQVAGWIADYGFVAQLGLFLPMLLLHWGIRRVAPAGAPRKS
jgi:RNA polymerase sigma factor (sigma-70 family)